MFAHIIFAALVMGTPKCHVDSITNCHYSDSVSVTVPDGVIWAEVHSGRYSVTFYPSN